VSFADRHIGRILYEARENAGLLLLEVAEALEVSVKYLLQIEYGAVRPSPKELLSLCKILHVSPQDLFSMDTPGLLTQEEKTMIAGDMPSAGPTAQAFSVPSSPSALPSASDATSSGVELVLPDGIRIRIGKDFDLTVLRSVLEALRAH
jgi:transcriptional regulator with XRE-family HTH domain